VTDVVELYLVRHADAGNPEQWDGPDAARPLSPKGEKQSERLGRFISGIGFRPHAVISSPKLRASQTADIIAGKLGVPVTLDERLAGGADVSDVEAILRDAGDPRRAVLVGHDPDFSSLLQALCVAPNVELKKGALARIDVERPAGPGRGDLRWLVPPDALKPG
jgi:phosphohistidine phosphatase